MPWHVLLLAYGSGVGAQSANLTPGGLGITEGTLGLVLVASGLRVGQALAAVLLYRLISFWLVASAGWLVFLWLHGAAIRGPGRVSGSGDRAARLELGSNQGTLPEGLVVANGTGQTVGG